MISSEGTEVSHCVSAEPSSTDLSPTEARGVSGVPSSFVSPYATLEFKKSLSLQNQGLTASCA